MLLGKGSYACVYATEELGLVRKEHHDEARYLSEVRAYEHGNAHKLLMPKMHSHGSQCITMQRYSKTLDRFLRGSTPRQRQAWADRHLGLLVSALERMHLSGMYHNDIHPGNILLDARDSPVFADFGAATIGQQRLVRCPTKRDYAAPEALADPANIGAAADRWSLGCCFYFACTGSLYRPGAPMPDLRDRRLLESLLDRDPRKRL